MKLGPLWIGLAARVEELRKNSYSKGQEHQRQLSNKTIEILLAEQHVLKSLLEDIQGTKKGARHGR